MKLGLDPRTADMMYLDIDYEDDLINLVMPTPIVAYTNEYVLDEMVIPCWSLGKLLNLFPDCTNDGYYLEIDRNMVKYVKRQFGFDAKVACFNKENFIESVIEALKHFCKKGKYNVE